ncbi:hypothetical protein O0L34_g15112 [Tuta absoluta]|nr:hypothetical protein O0L34_g15112 [Tuta absoluta]
MFLKVFTILSSIIIVINSSHIPHQFLQINKFNVNSQENYLRIDAFKQFLIENLISTSDSLKSILNAERESSKEENSKRNYDVARPVNEDLFEYFENLDEDLAGENENKGDIHPSWKKSLKFKRQALPSTGDSQIVMGTFQAMMRPMSVPSLPSLGGQSQQKQEITTTQENENEHSEK